MKHLKKIVLLLMLLMLVGCTSYRTTYDIVLSEVERSVDAKERYGEQEIANFEDEMVNII